MKPEDTRKYYSPTTTGFYLGANDADLPEDGQEISEEAYSQFFENQDNGHRQKFVDGRFIVVPKELQYVKDTLNRRTSLMSQEFINLQLPRYPDFEKLTFETQKSEARAWALDDTNQTPNVNILSLNRGIDREVLLEKISIKATQFEQLSMAIAGQRQKFEDLINKATTIEELDEISISFTA